MHPQHTALASQHWDIFCKVIDNFGDIGVCWRLAAGLAARGQQVRLWADDASALAWMAPEGCPGVTVRSWTSASPCCGADTPGDVVIEAFGCELDHAWIASAPQAVWLNLEYLSAEAFVQRSHGLPSLVMHGPARSRIKWFFYPGFTAGTGGLLREPEVCAASASQPTSPQRQRISLFCYEPTALGALLDQLAQSQQPCELLVTAGRASRAVEQAILDKNRLYPLWNMRKQLSFSYQLLMPHSQFDALLASCDLNCVRGEDSLVRALWAGKPFVWQLYPQEGDAHAAKLEAFLDWLQAPADLRLFHQVWNGLSPQALPPINLPRWAAVAQAARARLLQQPDLVTQLLSFVVQKSLKPKTNADQ